MSTALQEPQPGRQVRPYLLPQQFEPRWDQAAEEAVLGGILLIPDVLGEVREIVQADDFFLPCHQKVFSAEVALREQGSAIDPITVSNLLFGDPDLESRGGKSFIGSLPELAVPAINAPHHARIVKNLSQKRRANDICRRVLEDVLDAAEASEALAGLGESECLDSLPVIDAITFCLQTPEEPDWILDGYIARGAITELDAKIKTGKTHFTTDLIRAVLAGEDYLGRKTTRINVLYLTEERPTTFRAALKRVGLEEAPGLHLTFRHDARATWPEIARAVIAKAKALGIGLVVVDTLSVWSGIETDKENDAGAAMQAMRPVEAMAAAGLAVLVLRHERKSGGEVGESARGSSAFGGAADILLSLQKDPAAGHDNRRILGAIGRLEGWAPKLVLEMTDGRYRSLGTSAQVEQDKARQIVLALLPEDQGEALPEKDLLAQAGDETSRSTLKRALAVLVDEGVASRAKGVGTANPRAFGFWKTGGQS